MSENRPITGLDDDPPASPADALAIIQSQQARREPSIAPYFVLWGALWVLMGLAWFGVGLGMWSSGAAGIATGVLAVGGCVTSAWLGTRGNRGVAGPSNRFGAMYGIAWFTAIVGTVLLVAALVRLTGNTATELIPALFVFVVGVMYTVTGAFYRCTLDYVLGLVVQAVAVVTAFTPEPWNTLVMGIGGGGALLTVGFIRLTRR